MLSSPSPCLLQAVQAEGTHCVVIDPALIETEHGEVHYCEPLLTLLAAEPHPPVQALILLVLFKDQAACLPDWLTSLAAEIQPLSTPCSWRLTLANGLPLTLLLCERVGANPLPAIEALVASAIEASPAVVLIDGEGMPQNGCYRRPPRWYRNLMERSDIALVLLTCAADFGKIIDARKRARAYLCLYVHADTTGKYLWETRYNGYIAGDQLSPDQLQNLQSALLRINQAEMLISEQALALNHELRQQQACGNAWFTSYNTSVDVKFLLRSDDPRWSEGSNNYLFYSSELLPFPSISGYPDQAADCRHLTPYAPRQLADYYQGYLFYCLHGFELSLADIAAIGSVRFFLTVHYGFAQTVE